MGLAFVGIGALLGLAGLVCSIIVLIAAFQTSTSTGFLSLCVPFYILYFAFTQYQRPNKNVFLGIWIGLIIVSNVLSQVGKSMLASAAMGSGMIDSPVTALKV
jgi:hypothetical protein